MALVSEELSAYHFVSMETRCSDSKMGTSRHFKDELSLIPAQDQRAKQSEANLVTVPGLYPMCG